MDPTVLGKTYAQSSARMHMTLSRIKKGQTWAVRLDGEGSDLEHLGYCMSGGLAAGELTIVAGPPGNGKSYLALLMCCLAEKQGVPWLYQPLEDNQLRWMHRASAVWFDSWQWIGRDPDSLPYMEGHLRSHSEEVNALGTHICENPRLPFKDAAGGISCPRCTYLDVVEWLKAEAPKQKLIVVDPISMLDFKMDGQLAYEGQADFVQTCQGIATLLGAHIVLVCHTEKRPGSKSRLGLPDVQGAADITRFAHNVLLMDYHEPEDTDVVTIRQEKLKVSHKRTMVVAKAREGARSGSWIACDLTGNGARFREYGLVAAQ